jgi:hypothetical protein
MHDIKEVFSVGSKFSVSQQTVWTWTPTNNNTLISEMSCFQHPCSPNAASDGSQPIINLAKNTTILIGMTIE